VVHGASFSDEFVYDHELQRVHDADPPFLQYVPSVSRPTDSRNAHWQGAVGRVNEILETLIARWSPPRDDTVIYLCGHPGMIGDAARRLTPGGWTITREQYWHHRWLIPADGGDDADASSRLSPETESGSHDRPPSACATLP
jgi:NAD(P)H-flavin reductase